MWSMPCDEVKATIARDGLDSTRPDKTTICDPVTTQKVNFRYNNHLSCHARTCFKKGLECRANLPDMPEPNSRVLCSEKPFVLCNWRGQPNLVWNLTARPRRAIQDAYVNSHSIAISRCKAPANSNISITTGCRSATYASCYTAGSPNRVQCVTTTSTFHLTRASVATMVKRGELPPWALSNRNLRWPRSICSSMIESQLEIASS